MLDWSQCPAVERLPEKVGGDWLFKATRVRSGRCSRILKAARGSTIFEWLAGVTREQAEQVVLLLEDHQWLAGKPVGVN